MTVKNKDKANLDIILAEIKKSERKNTIINKAFTYIGAPIFGVSLVIAVAFLVSAFKGPTTAPTSDGTINSNSAPLMQYLNWVGASDRIQVVNGNGGTCPTGYHPISFGGLAASYRSVDYGYGGAYYNSVSNSISCGAGDSLDGSTIIGAIMGEAKCGTLICEKDFVLN